MTPQEVYDKVVVIDAGHGGRAPGANKQGVNEKEIDLDIVLQLKKILDEDDHNIGVYYTRTDDSNPTFDQRVQLANKSDADLLSAYITIPQTVEECPRQMVQQSCITSRMRANLEVSGWHRSV